MNNFVASIDGFDALFLSVKNPVLPFGDTEGGGGDCTDLGGVAAGIGIAIGSD